MNTEELSFWKAIYMATIAAAVDSAKNIYLLNQFAEEVAARAVEDLRKVKTTEGVDTQI